ncbi:MAG: glycosyltransferase family 4 protein [Verrucomicrobia bacterium]|nr:glycosyltransferase family 4 protein [Verrucomicrobiota bacterium]
MRVGIVLPKAFRRYSIDLDGYAAEIAASGHEPVVICPANEHPDFPFELVVYRGDEAARSEFWRSLSLDRVICMTWFGYPEVFRAIRTAGVRIINRADSDGLVSTRVFPSEAWLRLVHPFRGPLDFLKRARHFLNWYFSYWRQHDAGILEVLSLSDRVVVETELFRKNFEKFLRYHHREDLLARFSVVPHSVPDCFLAGPVPIARPKTIFCSGRWDDDQKNAPLLEACIRRVLRVRPDVGFVIAGFGVPEAFPRLVGFEPKVRLAGLLERESLPSELSACRFLLSSSRWESHPIGALEALCCGCSVVATPVPGFREIVGDGRFGCLAGSHSASSLAGAVIAELDCWDSGKRNPLEIASHWREEVNNKVVVRQLLSE